MPVPERIHYLIDLLLEGGATAEEQSELAGLLDTGSGEEAARLYLSETLQRTEALPVHSEQRWAAVRAGIAVRGKAEGRRLKKMVRIGGWLAAAAVLGIVLTRYFHTGAARPVAEKPVAVSHDRAPGRNVATLTLGDGSSIGLDSAVNGVLAQQGNTKIAKLGDGRLAYTAANQKPALLLFNTLATPRGGQYNLILPDGTAVWLNAASSITYPASFTGNDRVVRITGEVYFEVRRDPARPFQVAFNAGKDSGKIEVLGTHFNLNTYADEANVQATLLEGSIRVIARNATLLKPGQELKLDRDGRAAAIADADVDDVMAWKNGIFHFDHSDIATVMRQIARWYDVEVIFEGPPTKDRFDGDIPRSSQLSEVFRILELSRVHFKVEGRQVTVMP